MSLLLESIKLSDGQAFRLAYHQRRMALSYKVTYGLSCPFDLSALIEDIGEIPSGLVKLRVIYDRVSISYECQAYKKKEIWQLKLMNGDRVCYPLKYINRNALQVLFELKQDADDILIVKDQRITDTYYCNVAFQKNGFWYTPLTPLLQGTQRAALLDQGIIVPAIIQYTDLHHFEQVCLFNAMIEFGETVLPISAITR